MRLMRSGHGPRLNPRTSKVRCAELAVGCAGHYVMVQLGAFDCTLAGVVSDEGYGGAELTVVVSQWLLQSMTPRRNQHRQPPPSVLHWERAEGALCPCKVQVLAFCSPLQCRSSLRGHDIQVGIQHLSSRTPSEPGPLLTRPPDRYATALWARLSPCHSTTLVRRAKGRCTTRTTPPIARATRALRTPTAGRPQAPRPPPRPARALAARRQDGVGLHKTTEAAVATARGSQIQQWTGARPRCWATWSHGSAIGTPPLFRRRWAVPATSFHA